MLALPQSLHYLLGQSLFLAQCQGHHIGEIIIAASMWTGTVRTWTGTVSGTLPVLTYLLSVILQVMFLYCLHIKIYFVFISVICI